MTPDMKDPDDQFVIDDDGWKKYSQQLRESEGFDIKDYPGADPRVTIFPSPNYLECPSNVKMMKDYSAQALKLYNQKFDTKYEVNDTLKVNGDECGIYDVYYLTFTVTKGEKEYFQAKVVERLGEWSFCHIVDVKSVHHFAPGSSFSFAFTALVAIHRSIGQNTKNRKIFSAFHIFLMS
ncbi:uncharacterized protein LOC107870015 isoform X1 [Capsicum annuum]|uniref:uncharacterized protein LOC107870015 isoform X1 n=1 Tax=Capsicum annuum TaxID=4072 RepID=UPI001FB156CB|nr:uncharacterized protein LOC107870015 isoform X1 [Capsicum annuum]XP_047268292.1 uncharacterized protein LOC107870015 isoform X1 [Capsicum annuum]XP_047268293.1 uncharacterized protein LOC107870015 isoform X1 [Capsicum annuum]